MVLDAKSMDWAAENGIDTKQLKGAKIPIYGKWYFPEIPAGVPLVNLKTGEIQTFGPGLRAGEVLYVARDDLRRARLGPYAAVPEPTAAATEGAPETAAPASHGEDANDAPLAPGEEIHGPAGSIFPLILGFGFAITLLGLVAGPWEVRIIVILLGLIYLVTGGVGWGLELYHETRVAEGSVEHGQATTE